MVLGEFLDVVVDNRRRWVNVRGGVVKKVLKSGAVPGIVVREEGRLETMRC